MLEISDIRDRKVLARLVSAALRRQSLIPSFPRALEQRFESDGRSRRIAHLKMSILLGLVIYNLFVLTDPVLIPDVGWLGVCVRMLFLTPGGILLYVLLDRPFMTCRLREAAVSVAVIVFSLGPLALFWASKAPHAEFLLTQVLLTLFFGSNVLQLRLLHVVAMFGVNFAATMLVLAERDTLSAEFVAVLLANTACAGLFGFICNQTIERSTREAFLLSLQERLRSEGLSEDRNKLAVLSETDWLTGTANRRSLDQHLDMIWSDPERRGEAALLLLDIDHFKRFNDFYGHLGGDQCLRHLSALLVAVCSRPGVFLARYGGEEFAVAVEGMADVELTAFAEDLCRSVTASNVAHLGRDDGLAIVTISVGVARVGDEAVVDRHGLFAAADKALYAAKRIGRNRVVRFGSLEMSLARSLAAAAGEPGRARRRPAIDANGAGRRLAS